MVTLQESGRPYYAEHVSLEGYLVFRASHTHGRYRNNNVTLYHNMEEATRGAHYSESIKPFQRQNNGRLTLTSMEIQYVGQDKWDAKIKKIDALLHTRKWKGQSNLPLEKFVQQHRNAYISMQECTVHVQYQLLNDNTRVGYFLDVLDSQHLPLLSAAGNIEEDNGIAGKRNDFELAVAYILPKDPVLK